MAFPSLLDCWKRPSPIQNDFSINYAENHNLTSYRPELLRTTRELMATLNKHFDSINNTCRKNYITSDQLTNYLLRCGDDIAPQDKADLHNAAQQFDRIAKTDGKSGKGISYSAMARYVLENQKSDQMVLIYRENENLRRDNARLKEELCLTGRCM